MSNLCKGSMNLWNKHVSSTLNCLFRLMCIDIRLIIPGAAKDRALLCVCPPLRREKLDTPAVLQTLRSYAASFFTPCQTPRCPALTVQQPPLNPFVNRHAGEDTNKAFAIFHTLSPLPHTWCLRNSHKPRADNVMQQQQRSLRWVRTIAPCEANVSRKRAI